MSIILDENNRPVLEEKNIHLSRIFDSLARGKSLKEICCEFSLTHKQMLAIFQYAAELMQNKQVLFHKKKVGNLIVYIDGAARGNPGDAGIGIVFYDEEGLLLKEVKEYIGIATNNVAEYKALIKALVMAGEELGASKVKVFTDSELVTKQISGYYKVKNDELKELFSQVRELFKKFKKVEINHIERGRNKQADKLANMAINLK